METNKILLIGNPNVGKTTLFNSLTRSNEHTGNFHGVTVEDKHKTVDFEGRNYDFVDLPGIYSLNCFSYEEEVSKKAILKKDSKNIVITDANSFRRNLYLCLQLSELEIDYKLLINNYDYFKKHKNSIDIAKLKQTFPNAEIINAKKVKLNGNLLNFSKSNIKTDYLNPILSELKIKYGLDKASSLLALNGEYDGLNQTQIEGVKSILPEVVKARYNFIDNALKNALTLKENYVFGHSQADKFILNPIVITIGFLIVFFASIYSIFFLIGPAISNLLMLACKFFIINPFMNFLYSNVNNIWVIQFFSEGVFSSFSTIITFLPQVCLLFAFLIILEDSGLISRMAYVFDDFLSIFGLNGKAVYVMLLGLGCNTMSAMASRNMDDKSLKIKTAILNPYISCMARLPIFVLVASAFFGAKAYFVVVGLYFLGLVVALILGIILNKTILKTKTRGLLLEFPPIKPIDFPHLLSSIKLNAIDFAKRVFSVVLMVGIFVWLLSHTEFNFTYTSDIKTSMLYIISNKISFIFAPIGLNSAGIICALISGMLAKELIVSIFSISNGVATIPALITSITSSASLISFTMASAVSFLIFALLYSPCVSTLAVIKREAGKFWFWFSLISQFTIAYSLSFVVYTALTKGFWLAVVSCLIIALILGAILFIIKKSQRAKCWGCNRCNKR